MAVANPEEVRLEEVHLVATVHGRVQAVGFRYFVAKMARAQGIRGYVHNLVGGGVEVVAEGPRLTLEALVDELRVGPPLASVRAVDVSWSQSERTLHEFHIRA